MMTTFLLMTEPRWIGFLLKQEGRDEAHEFETIPEALAFARAQPDVEGAPFVVFDDKGRQFLRLTV